MSSVSVGNLPQLATPTKLYQANNNQAKFSKIQNQKSTIDPVSNQHTKTKHSSNTTSGSRKTQMDVDGANHHSQTQPSSNLQSLNFVQNYSQYFLQTHFRSNLTDTRMDLSQNPSDVQPQRCKDLCCTDLLFCEESPVRHSQNVSQLFTSSKPISFSPSGAIDDLARHGNLLKLRNIRSFFDKLNKIQSSASLSYDHSMLEKSDQGMSHSGLSISLPIVKVIDPKLLTLDSLKQQQNKVDGPLGNVAQTSVDSLKPSPKAIRAKLDFKTANPNHLTPATIPTCHLLFPTLSPGIIDINSFKNPLPLNHIKTPPLHIYTQNHVPLPRSSFSPLLPTPKSTHLVGNHALAAATTVIKKATRNIPTPTATQNATTSQSQRQPAVHNITMATTTIATGMRTAGTQMGIEKAKNTKKRQRKRKVPWQDKDKDIISMAQDDDKGKVSRNATRDATGNATGNALRNADNDNHNDKGQRMKRPKRGKCQANTYSEPENGRQVIQSKLDNLLPSRENEFAPPAPPAKHHHKPNMVNQATVVNQVRVDATANMRIDSNSVNMRQSNGKENINGTARSNFPATSSADTKGKVKVSSTLDDDYSHANTNRNASDAASDEATEKFIRKRTRANDPRVSGTDKQNKCGPQTENPLQRNSSPATNEKDNWDIFEKVDVGANRIQKEFVGPPDDDLNSDKNTPERITQRRKGKNSQSKRPGSPLSTMAVPHTPMVKRRGDGNGRSRACTSAGTDTGTNASDIEGLSSDLNINTTGTTTVTTAKRNRKFEEEEDVKEECATFSVKGDAIDIVDVQQRKAHHQSEGVVEAKKNIMFLDKDVFSDIEDLFYMNPTKLVGKADEEYCKELLEEAYYSKAGGMVELYENENQTNNDNDNENDIDIDTGALEEKPQGGKKTSRNANGALHVVAPRLLKIMIESGGTVDISQTAKAMGLRYRRLNDVVNILDGVGLLEKSSRNHFSLVQHVTKEGERMRLHKELKRLTMEEKKLDKLISKMQKHLNKMLNNDKSKFARVSIEDIKELPEMKHSTVIGIQTVKESEIFVPRVDSDDGSHHPHRLYVKSDDGRAIDCFLLDKDEVGSDSEREVQLEEAEVKTEDEAQAEAQTRSKMQAKNQVHFDDKTESDSYIVQRYEEARIMKEEESF